MKTNSYPSDLTDSQWELIHKLVPAPKSGGRPALYGRREIVNGILYLARSGCSWRQLPHELPPYATVFHHFRIWSKEGLWKTINAVLRESVRHQAGRTAQPSAGVVDSQSVKTADQGGLSGFDAGKKIKGRKHAGSRRGEAASGRLPRELPVPDGNLGGFGLSRTAGRVGEPSAFQWEAAR